MREKPLKDRIRVAKRALRKVKGINVPLEPMMNLNDSQGLVLGDMKFSAKVSRFEMLGLLLSTSYNEELLDDMDVQEFDLTQVAQKFSDQLINKLWPRKGLSERWFDKQGIEELKTLTQELDRMCFSLEFNEEDANDVAKIREQLKAIRFCFV